MNLTTITHTRDSAADLPRLLATTAWADERIVVDMHSSDETATLAGQAGCRVLLAEPVPRVDGIRNDYLGQASNEWVLVLDSDEYLADDAESAIEALIVEHGADVDAFSIPRFNYIGDQLLRGSGWYPDHQIRLFRNGAVRWSDTIHRPPEVVGGYDRLHILEPPGCLHIHHRNYRDLSEVIGRQLHYALTDVYDGPFDFGDYVSRAYNAFSARHQQEDDAELSTALATVMAWDAVMRGLIHWDRQGREAPLREGFALPVVTSAPAGVELELAAARQRLAELEGVEAELALLKSSTWWRLRSGLLRRFPRTVGFAGRGARGLMGLLRGDRGRARPD